MIIASGLYLFADKEVEEEGENEDDDDDDDDDEDEDDDDEDNDDTGFIKCFEQEKRKENFYTLFGRLKDDRQKFFKYFRINFLKLETWNSCWLLHTDI